jgi:tRNA-dihydrouridine synthase
VEEAGVAAIGFHPRSAAVHHKGAPDYDLAARLVESLPAPVILSGGLRTAEAVATAHERTGAAAVMLARGSLGNPWLFEELLGARTEEPTPDEVLAELDWMMDAAADHFGPERAARWMRKAYPWYMERLGAGKSVQAALQATDSLAAARAVLSELRPLLHCAALPA